MLAMWYNIDWNKFAIEALPTGKRKPKIIAFVKVLISPVKSLYEEFKRNQREDNHKLYHNGQICYLRKALNDKFDNDLRRIYINDGNNFESEFIFTHPEDKPRFLDEPIFLRQREDYADTGVDFKVFVPREILANLEVQITAEINYFKEGVKKYELVAI